MTTPRVCGLFRENPLISSGFPRFRSLRNMRADTRRARRSRSWCDLVRHRRGPAVARGDRRASARPARRLRGLVRRVARARRARVRALVRRRRGRRVVARREPRRAAGAGVLARVRAASDRCASSARRRTTTSTTTRVCPSDVEQVDPVAADPAARCDQHRGLGGVRDPRGPRQTAAEALAVWGATGRGRRRPWVPAAARRRGAHRARPAPRRDIGLLVADGRPSAGAVGLPARAGGRVVRRCQLARLGELCAAASDATSRLSTRSRRTARLRALRHRSCAIREPRCVTGLNDGRLAS